MRRYAWLCVMAGVLFSVWVAPGYGLGIRQPEQGAAATGQNDAFVAQADDPSAIYYNPGGLTQIKGTEAMSGVYFNGPQATYTGSGPAAGNSKGTRDQVNFMPHFYAVSDFGMDWFRAGIGVYTPFGQSVDWGNNNSFRYVTTRAGLQMANVNPTVAFKLCDYFSLGVGLDYYYCDTDLRKGFPFVVPGVGFVGEGNFRFEGHGEGIGGNVGGLFKINDQNYFGVSYRSPVDVEFDGHAKVSDIPPALNPVFGTKDKEHGHAEFNFPQIVQFGYAFWPTKKWKLEADADWTNWDVVNGQNLKSKGLRDTFGLTQSQLNTKMNWQDSWIVELGTQYEVKPNLFLRGGWYWSQDSVPEKTFNPTVADSDRVGVSLGVGYKLKSWSFDVAYQFNVSLDRNVKNTVGNDVGQSVNGEYESYSQGGAVSIAYHF